MAYHAGYPGREGELEGRGAGSPQHEQGPVDPALENSSLKGGGPSLGFGHGEFNGRAVDVLEIALSGRLEPFGHIDLERAAQLVGLLNALAAVGDFFSTALTE